MRLPRTTFLLLGLALLNLVNPLPAQGRRTKAPKTSGKGWPFGSPGGGSVLSRRSRMDLYNLGILGAKAWDGDKPEPGPRTGGRRQFSSSGKPAHDDGPARLLIKAIFPGGPADKAGLHLQDVLIAVNGKSLAKGSLDIIAKALLKAETTKGKNKVQLKVERKGEKLDLVAEIPYGGRELAKPFVGKGQEILLKKSLDWLRNIQNGTGGFAQSLGGNNGAVVMTSLAGLAWLSAGSSLKRGKYRKNLKTAYEFAVRGLTAKDPFAGRRSSGASWNQTTWAYAYTGIFLGELHAASPSRAIKRELQTIARELLARQEVSGGYAHGPGGVNALGYLELNIISGFVLTTLGLAQQAGCEVDQERVKKLLAYLEASSSGGGVGYSAKPRQKGSGNIGRTAGAWLGARALGMGNKKFVKSMGAWTKNNVDKVLNGHATLMQHIMLAGVAAKAHGSKATSRFWGALARDFTLARAPDGSFQPRPWHESLLMQSNTDVSMGQVWTTACWAIVLGAGKQKDPKAGLPAWTGRNSK